MSTKLHKSRSPVDKAFGVLRKDENGSKADAVFVCRMYRNEDGSWQTDASFRHWIKNLPPEQKEGLPSGVPGAVISAVVGQPIQKHLGGMLKEAASAALAPHVGANAVGVIGEFIDTFTKRD